MAGRRWTMALMVVAFALGLTDGGTGRRCRRSPNRCWFGPGCPPVPRPPHDRVRFARARNRVRGARRGHCRDAGCRGAAASRTGLRTGRKPADRPAGPDTRHHRLRRAPGHPPETPDLRSRAQSRGSARRPRRRRTNARHARFLRRPRRSQRPRRRPGQPRRGPGDGKGRRDQPQARQRPREDGRGRPGRGRPAPGRSRESACSHPLGASAGRPLSRAVRASRTRAR